MKTRILAIAGALAAAFTASGAQADPCAGASPFTDVLAGASYCTNTEWLKNRAVTTGCGGTSYCPNDVVNRASMALFMNRLGKALSPEVVFADDATLAITVPDVPPAHRVCLTADTAAATYPRTAILQGMFTGIADANAIAWFGALLYSTDGGTTYAQPVANSPLGRASSAGLQWSGLSLFGTLDLVPGLQYRFVIGLRRDTVLTGTTGNFTAGRCQLLVTIVNRNGTSSPFDAAPNDGDGEP